MLKTYPCHLSGKIKIISSKSYIHRLLILSAVAKKSVRLNFNSSADDIQRTADALRSLGAEIIFDNEGCFVTPLKASSSEENITCDLYESGSSYRFLLPFVGALGKRVTFTGAKRLFERPIKDLMDTLKEHSMQISDDLPVKTNGMLTSGIYNIKGNVSSQFITGLLLSLPLLKGDSQIHIKGELASRDYVNITLDCMKHFGNNITATDYGFYVRGGGYSLSPSSISVEGDFSNAAFWLVGGAINGSITICGLNLNSSQGDKKIIDILVKMGADIVIGEDKITVNKSQLKAIDIDAKDIPDLVPIISIAAAYSEGVTLIRNVERLRDKECDRLEAVMAMLEAIGIECSYDKALRIVGGKVKGGLVKGYNDHRIVMSGAIASVGSQSFIEITDTLAVNKSYPDFFDVYISLGGKNV